MQLVLKYSTFYFVLLVFGILVPYTDNYELTFFTWIFIFLTSIVKKYNFSIINCVLPYIIILGIAIVVGFLKNSNLYFMIRDITYLLKPIVGFLIGYQLFKKLTFKKYTPIDLLIIIASFLAFYHFLLIFNGIVIQGARTIADIRHYSGHFSDFEIYIFALLLFYKKFDISFSHKTRKFLTILIGFSAFMYLARTNFIQFLILFLCLKGYFTLSKKTFFVISSIFIAGIVSYLAIIAYNPNRSAEGVDGFLYKLKVAPYEPFKTYVNRYDYKDFNDNYRSYENIMTVRQMMGSDFKTLFLGKGIGSQVDLKQSVMLGDMELRHISILHNGFMIVFLKSGLIGILIYFFTIVFFFKNPKPDTEYIKNINLLFVATGVFLIISNWVFLGFYNLTESKSVLIGFLIAYRYKLLNEKDTNYTSIG